MSIRRAVRKLLGRGRWRPVVATPDSRATLTLSYLAFKDLITSNDELLEAIADLERQLEGETRFGMTYIRFRAVACATHAYRMIICLDKLSSRRYQELHVVFAAIQRSVDRILAPLQGARSTPGPFIYPLSAVDATLGDRVGGKAANVGEMMNRAHLPVPDGFAVSVDAFAALFAADQLGEEVRARQVDLNPADLQGLNDVSQVVQQTILAREVPPAVATAIVGAYDDLARRVADRGPQHGSRVGVADQLRVAVRSSAVGEDGERSFAGQYASVLNVSRAGLIDAYREVVASLYSPRALFYRTAQGIPEEDIPMGVLCMLLVDAAASGMACSVNPGRPDEGTVLVTGAWGLGVAPVGGIVSSDTWDVSRTASLQVVRARAGSKETSIEAKPDGGVAPGAAPHAAGSTFCLTDAQVIEIARLVLAAESHYGRPQEIEWALDRQGRLAVLQCRPLRVDAQPRAARAPAEAALDGHRLLLTGSTAAGGCASGAVVRLAESDDAALFPTGAVLVARHSSPHYVRVMERAAAIVTDIGATTGHMASLAREFGVPAVVGTGAATTALRDGQIVTVDATGAAVYDGRVDSLLAAAPSAPARTMKDTPVYAILRQVADAIVPLNLTDPRDPAFRPRACRTFHDIARFAHEKAFDEMFRMSDRVADATRSAVRLDERLPYELYLIDIGGGLRRHPSGRIVHTDDLLSEPMRALLQGMTNPALRWWEPRQISMSGFLSVATEAMMSPRDVRGRQLGDRSYAIVAEAYCNFSSRIGYHFAAVDAYCSPSPTRNYVSFRFKGGAADDRRRAKRCEVIGEILERIDFHIERVGDLVNARLRKYPRDVIVDRLDQIGRLVVATRQLDMRMGPGSDVRRFADAFLAGDYLFDATGHASRSASS